MFFFSKSESYEILKTLLRYSLLRPAGGGSLENILSPGNASKHSSSEGNNTPTYSGSRLKGASSTATIEPTLAALEAAVKSSKSLCADLESSLSVPAPTTPGGRRKSSASQLNTNSSLNDVALLIEQIHDMEALLVTLRNGI